MTATFSPTTLVSPLIAMNKAPPLIHNGLIASCTSDGTFGGGGVGSPPGAGAPPPTSPPGGRYFSTSDIALLGMLEQRLPLRRYPLYDMALAGLMKTRDVIQRNGDVGARLHATTISMTNAIDQEISLVPVSEWANIASALFMLGRMHFITDSTSNAQRTELLRGAAHFSQYVDQRRTQQDADELVPQDQLLTFVTMHLSGSIEQLDLTSRERAALASPVHRVALAGGSVQWPRGEIPLPHLAQPLSRLYPGVAMETLRQARLLPPSIYTGAVWSWRPSSIGYAEHIIATYLDRPLCETMRHFDDDLIDSPMIPARPTLPAELRSILTRTDASRQATLKALVEHSYSSFDMNELRQHFSLIAFLHDALGR